MDKTIDNQFGIISWNCTDDRYYHQAHISYLDGQLAASGAIARQDWCNGSDFRVKVTPDDLREIAQFFNDLADHLDDVPDPNQLTLF